MGDSTARARRAIAAAMKALKRADEALAPPTPAPKSPPGRQSRGGAARAAKLSAERRSEIAKAGAAARWKKEPTP